MRILTIALFALFAACGLDPAPSAEDSTSELTSLDQASLDQPSLDEASLSAGQACTPGGSECERDEFCSRPVGMCAAVGTCAKKPAISQHCTDVIVCGCDGNTYSNGCAAARAGQSIAAIGNCPF